ncbi:MAG: HD-GYP domain-containing protein [Planctomycetota bacterium]
MGGTATREQQTTYTAIPMAGLVGADAVPFPLYLRTASKTWVLYRPADTVLDESHIGRLHAEGVPHLFIQDEHRAHYFQRVEREIDAVLLDKELPLDNRADVLQGVAMMVADELLRAQPDERTVRRAHKVMMATSGLMLRESQGFHALRRVLQAGPGLARHSLTVAFMSMGLARVVLTRDPATLATIGLAGLLHDVGKVGHEDLEHDPEHTTRGADYLRSLNLPAMAVDAALFHHECHDGSGFPRGLRHEEIPEGARIVGLVNLFDKIYSAQEPRVGVFDALRILAQAYRGCFDERMAQGLVKLFR